MSFMSNFEKALNDMRASEGKSPITVSNGSSTSSKKKKKSSFMDTFQSELDEDEDIAPITSRITSRMTTDSFSDLFPLAGRGEKEKQSEEDEEEDSKLDFLQKGAFEDGFDWSDIPSAILGTAADAGLNVVKGVGSLVEGVVDLGQYAVSGVADLLGEEETAKEWKDAAKWNLVDSVTKDSSDYLDQYSVLGNTSKAILQGVGQVGGLVATAGFGAAAGLGTAGTTALTTGAMGLSGMGSGMGEAYQGGATDEEAVTYGLISGAADALTELMFGGLGKAANAIGLSKGLFSADDMLAKAVSSKFKTQIAKNFAEFGVKASAEGVEEVVAGVAQAMGKKFTYMSEKDFKNILEDENLLEQFIVGASTSGMIQSGIIPGTKKGSLIEANKNESDFLTGTTKNEQAVIDKEVENRIAEKEKDGTKLTKKEKAAIEEQVVRDMEKGYISTDTIEEVLGGGTYNIYKSTVDSEESILREYDELGKKTNATLADQARYTELTQQVKEIREKSQRNQLKSQLGQEVSELVKGDRLIESYNEQTRKTQAYQTDLTKYDAKQQTVIQNAIDSGILNNSNRTHEFVDMVAKISADKGVLFDFTNNQKLKDSGFAVDGKQVNGYVTKDGITLNIDSKKAMETTVGHEITHVLEGTEFYDSLKQTIFDYAKTKGEYQSRYDSLAELYKDVKDADIESELTADLVGDYLFSDPDFISNLSTKNRNVFQKIYDEIKYLCKIATAGSKEARELERVKKAFEDAYRADGKAQSETKYSVGYHAGDLGKAESYFQQGGGRSTGHFGTGTYFVGNKAAIEGYNKRNGKPAPVETVEFDNYNLYKVYDDEQGYKLHDKLHTIDRGFSQEYLDAAIKDKFRASELRNEAWKLGEKYETKEWNDEFGFELTTNFYEAGIRAMTEVAQANNVEFRSYAEHLEYIGEDVKPGDDDYDLYQDDYYDYLKKTLEEADEKRNDGYSRFRDAHWDLRWMFGRENVNRALQAVLDHDTAMEQADYDTMSVSDSRATVFMKALGYEGIDVRGTRLDNTTYGSVIYDLKGADAKRKAEIGTAKYSLSDSDGRQLSKEQQEAQETNEKLSNVGMQYDSNSGTVSYSLSSLEDAFDYNKGEDEYHASREEYANALAKATGKTPEEANRYLDSMFLVHDMIAADRNRLDYDSAPNKSAWVSNAEYGGSIDFSTLCAKRRLFTGTFDAIQNALPDTVLNDTDFLNIRKLLLESGQESPCSMCYVEGSRAKHGVYVSKFLKEYLKTNPEWKPQIADFASTTRLEQTRIQHPEAYAEYQKAMNKLSQRKPKEASVRTDYKGEILRDFKDTSTVAEKNKNGGVRFNSFSDFEIIHAIDCMQVLTDMSRVGLNGQAYTKVKEFAEAFGNTGLKINLSLVAKGVDTNGKLVMDETNGMNYAEAMDIRNRYSENVGTVIVVFNDRQLMAALADNTIDYVLPFHRSQWKKSQYELMGLPHTTRDYTNIQNDRYKNPKTGRAKKAPNGNIMPNEYWDFTLSGRENAQKYLDYINENGYIPKFDFLLKRVDGDWVLPEGEVGDGYFKLLIDFKMYNNDGVGSPQMPVLPEFNMPYIQEMLDNYVGGHQAFPVAHDVVDKFVNGKKNGDFSLSNMDEAPVRPNYRATMGEDIALEGVAPVAENATTAEENSTVQQETQLTEENSTVPVEEMRELFPDDPDISQTELDNLRSVNEALENRMLEMAETEDWSDLESVNDEYMAVQARMAVLEAELAESESDRIGSIEDADAPPEMDAPLSMESDNYNPFGGIGLHEITRSTRSYSDRNPGARRFFEEAALGFLYDVNNSTHGERWYNDQLYYDSGGEQGFGGTSRHTTSDIADLKDTYGYTWDALRNAAEAVANGDFRSVAAKRVEYLLNTRLMEGYTDVDGRRYEPNQEYISFLNEHLANQQAQEQFDSFMETADMYAPEDIAPVATVKTLKEATPDTMQAPIFESKEKGTLKGQTSLFEDKRSGGKVAQVLTEEPKVNKKSSKIWSMVKEHLLDNGMVFEDLSKQTGNRALEGKWNFIRYSQARAQKLIGKGTDGVRSLKDMKKEIEQSGKTEQFYDYLYHKHNVDRMNLEDRFDNTENKPVFGYAVTSDVSKAVAERYEKANPEFKRYANEVYGYMNHLRSLLVENDVISQETADLWANMYPHYVPIRRAGQDGLNISVPLDTRKTGVNNPVKRATGGNQNILPLFDTMAQRTVQTYKAISKNNFGIELKNTLGSVVGQDTQAVDDVINSIDNEDALLKPGVNGENPTFTVFENGERVEFEITEEMYNALKPKSEAMAYRNKILNTASNVFRGLTTQYSLPFMATNAIKDAQDVLINSQHPLRTYANMIFPRAQFQQLFNGKWYQEYIENGGEDNTYFDSETNVFKEDNWAMKGLKLPLNIISTANNFIEMTPRLAEYIASREAGRSIEVSMLDAARVTTNFAAGGDVTKFLNGNGATFLNASVQGAIQQVRNVREAHHKGLMGYIGLATRFALAGLPAVLLNNLMWDDDEEYEELADYVKQDYYVIGKYDDGKFIRIPKGRTVAVIQNAIEQVQNAATGDGEVDLGAFLQLAVNNLAPNNPLDNNILAPISQVLTNRTWYGDELVDYYMQQLPELEQYDENTSSVSIALSKKINELTGAEISPVKIDYLLNQYSGGVGDVLLPMSTPKAEHGDDSLLGNLMAPLKDKFTTDSVLNSKRSGEYKEAKDAAHKAAKSKNATDEDLIRSQYFYAKSDEMSELYDKKREIQNSDLSDSEKFEQVRDIQAKINAIAEEALTDSQSVYVNGFYATVGDKRFDYSDYSDKWYEIDGEYLEREQNAISRYGITPEDYWNDTDLYYKADYYFKYSPELEDVSKRVFDGKWFAGYASEVSQLKGDDLDGDGKSDSGTKKKKVFDYIDGLDVDDIEKKILRKMSYPSEDKYNNEIIEYLNDRDDISYDDMKTILEALDFKVDSEGYITW